MKTIRSDKWELAVGQHLKAVKDTINLYRFFVQHLIGLVFVHWPEIGPMGEKIRQKIVENLIHKTERNDPKYKIFNKRFHKFPSYLRRAAIMAAIGQVSSFTTRYAMWQSGRRKRRDAKPPKLGSITNINPVLYNKNCIRYHESFVEIKVFKNNDWVWINVPIIKKGERHLLHKQMSPSLILKGKKLHLSMPFTIAVEKQQSSDKLCSVDLGINKGAVGSIVHKDGTVTARRFIDRAADIDQRDRGLQLISSKAKKTIAKNGKLSEGFCRGHYRKAANRNMAISQSMANEIYEFAKENGCTVIVFENMKGFRPRGGKKGSTLKQRFHGWLHRRVVKLVENKLIEEGKRLSLVCPAGTSKYAFDGSGKVKRDNKNYSLATFSNGKKYHSDLSASYNIGAKHWIKLIRREAGRKSQDKSSCDLLRMPVTLSTLWSQDHNVAKADAGTIARKRRETPRTRA